MSTDNIPTEAVQEKDGEAGELIEKIKDFITTLDARDLKADALRLLADNVNRLVEISEARESRGQRIEELQTRLRDWQQENSVTLVTAPIQLKEILEGLGERIEVDEIDQEGLDIVLDECSKVLNRHKQIIELQEDLDQANKEMVDSFERSGRNSSLEKPKAPVGAGRTATDIKKGHERQKNDPITTSQRESHREMGTSLEPETNNASKSILGKKQIGHSFPDDSKDTPPREEDSEEPSKDRSSQDEGVAPVSITSEQPDSIDEIRAVVSPNDKVEILQIEEGIAKALKRNRFGVAYHLARINPDTLPDSDTVTLIAANYVTDDTAPVSAELHNVANSLLSKAKTTLHEKQILIPVLVVSAALSPALIAPGGPVAQLLSFMESHLGDMQALRVLVQATADVSRTGVALSVELLQGGISQEDWNARVSALQREGENWIRDEYQAKIRFAPATAVWRRIVEEWKEERCTSIGYMFKLLTKPPNEINIKEVSQIAEYWRRNPESEIDRIDRSRRESSKKRIEGPSRSSLLDKIEKAISFADRWDELLKARPDKRSTFQTEQAEKLRTAVRNHGEAALEEIAGLSAVMAPKSKELVQRFIDKFSDSQMELPTSRLRLEDLLNGNLLVDPDIPLPCDNEEQETVGVAPLLRLAEQDKFDFPNAIIERAERGDFRGAETTFDFAARCGSLDGDSADRIRTQIEKERSRVIERLTTEIHEANNQLDAAYAQGILMADEVEQWRLNISQTDLAEDDDFKRYHMKLEEIDGAVKNVKQKRREEMEQQLASLESASVVAQERIRNAIQNGRFQVAEDYIERIQNKKSLPRTEVETNHAFDDFFPAFVESYASFRDQTEDASNALSLVQNALKNRENAGPVDARHLSKDASHDGTRLLQAWSELRTTRKITNEKLNEFLSTLGFTNVKLSAYGDQAVTEKTPRLLAVKPITDRRIAQLPEFGSRVDGRYRLIVIRDYETEEAIIQEIEERKLDGQPPNIVVFFNMLDAEARREIARSLERVRDFGGSERRSV